MNLAFLGTGDFAVPALQALARAGHTLRIVLSQPDRAAGRGRKVAPTPVHAAADELKLRHVQTDDINGLDAAALFSGVEMGVVAAFGQKLGEHVLRAVPRGFVNIHASLLPRYRGAAPYQWAIINGDERTGVTIFQLERRFDTGPVWAMRDVAIEAGETADELHDRLARLGAELAVEAVRAIATGTARPLPQNPAQATRAPKLTKSDGTVDWAQPAECIVRRIHGLWSWPGAACTFTSRSGRQERVLLARAEVADPDATPGSDAPTGAFVPDRSVQAGRGRVRILELKPAGGRLMRFDEFANGRSVAPPDRLESTAP